MKEDDLNRLRMEIEKLKAEEEDIRKRRQEKEAVLRREIFNGYI